MGAWQIPLSGVKAPAPNPSPLEAVYQAQNQNLNAQSMMSQDALRQQQIQQAQLQNQIQQMQINAQQAYNDEMKQTYANIANRAAAPSSPPPASSPSTPSAPSSPADSSAPAPAATTGADAMGSANAPAPLAGGYLGSANDNSGVGMSYGTEATPGSISGAASPTTAATAATATASPAAGGSPTPTASPQSTPPARTSSVPVMTPDDLADFARRMALRGQGVQIPGIMKTQYDLMETRLKIEKADAENHQAAATAIAQTMQGIAGMPAANGQETQNQQAAYQQAVPRLQQLTAQMGLNPANLPQQFDPIAAQRMIANGTTVADYNSNRRALATAALNASVQFPKAYDEAKGIVNKEIAPANSALDYANRYNGLANQATAEEQANPNGTSFIRQALANLPKPDAQGNSTWNPQVSRDAMLDPLTPEQRQTYIQKSVTDGADRLAIMAGYGPKAFQDELTKIASGQEMGVDPTVADLFKGFHTTDDPKADAAVIRNMGMTAAQASVADLHGKTMTALDQRILTLEAARAAMFGPGGTKLPGYEKPLTPSQQTQQDLQTGMNKVMTDVNAVFAGQGQTPTNKDYAAAVRDTTKWTGDPTVTANRAAIATAFDKQALNDANTARVNSQTAKNQGGGALSGIARMQWMRDHPGQPVPDTLPAPAGKTSTGQTRTPSMVAPPGSTPSAQAPGGTPKGPTAKPTAGTQTYGIGGRYYKVGDPISIGGKMWKFQGYDANGKIIADPL
jgi:Tfp pilus assembly protein PilV